MRVEKASFVGSKGDAPLDWKTNPPVPPLDRGVRKSTPPLPGGGHCLGEGHCLGGGTALAGTHLRLFIPPKTVKGGP